MRIDSSSRRVDAVARSAQLVGRQRPRLRGGGDAPAEPCASATPASALPWPHRSCRHSTPAGRELLLVDSSLLPSSLQSMSESGGWSACAPGGGWGRQGPAVAVEHPVVSRPCGQLSSQTLRWDRDQGVRLTGYRRPQHAHAQRAC